MHLRIERIAFRNFRNYETFRIGGLGAADRARGPERRGKDERGGGRPAAHGAAVVSPPSLEQMVRQGADFARLDADVTDGSRELALSLQVSGGRNAIF